MKYWTCPCCGKQLIRLEPYYDNRRHEYYCDTCEIDITMYDHSDNMRKKIEEKENKDEKTSN